MTYTVTNQFQICSKLIVVYISSRVSSHQRKLQCETDNAFKNQSIYVPTYTRLETCANK